VVLFDGGLLSRRCAEAAARQHVPIVHVGAEPQALEEHADPHSPRVAISRLAALRFDCQSTLGGGLLARDRPSHRVGNLLVDALHHSWTVARRDPRNSGPLVALRQHVDARRGYGVVALRQTLAQPGCPCKPETLALLREVSRDLPLVWPMRQSTMVLARSRGLTRTLEGDRIAHIEELGHVKFVRLLRNATCVLTDSPDVMEEAAALAVPCLGLGADHSNHVDAGGWLPTIKVGSNAKLATRAVWQILFSGSGQANLPDLWDGDSGSRIAEHLARWLEESVPEHAQRGALRHSFHTGGGVGKHLTT
jgi:UDP-N-acetylglucosamine 2-epimerase (non-hydrolysing)